MREWSVYLFVLILLLRVLCNGVLIDKYEIDVYVYSDVDAQRFQKNRLQDFHPYLLRLYEVCDNKAKQIYEILPHIVALYNIGVHVPERTNRIYDYMKLNLPINYKNCMAVNKEMSRRVESMVTTTCYKELQEWINLAIEECRAEVNQMSDDFKDDYETCNNIKLPALEEFLDKRAKIYLNSMIEERDNLGYYLLEFHDKIYNILEKYIKDLMIMKHLSCSKNDMRNFSIAFIANTSLILSTDFDRWNKKLDYLGRVVPKTWGELDDIENKCCFLEKSFVSVLEPILNAVTDYKETISLLTNAEYFLVKNDSLIELGCDDYIPIVASKLKERLTSKEVTSDGTTIWNFEYNDENNGSYNRVLTYKYLTEDVIEVHETIIYLNSEIASLNNTFNVKFKN